MRVNKDKDFQYLREDIAEFKTQRNKNNISLNEAERRKEREAQESRIKAREQNSEVNAAARRVALQDDGLLSNERNLDADLAIEEGRKNAKDVLLNEAVHILSDEVGLLQSNPKFAANVAPKANLH
jgi:carboxyl-terminal processing protease